METGITQGATNLVEIWGVPGFFILVLAGVIIYLWREIKAERKLNSELQEKRFADMIVYTNAIDKFLETNEKLFDNFKQTIDQLRNTVDQLRSK